MRAILVAPRARDLYAEFGHCVPVPGAASATRQLWDTNRRDLFVGQPGITVHTSRESVRQDIPQAIPFLMLVLRSDSAVASVNVAWKRLADCGANDYFRVRSSSGTVSVKRKGQMVAGDKPVDWHEAHSWFGVADDLGVT